MRQSIQLTKQLQTIFPGPAPNFFTGNLGLMKELQKKHGGRTLGFNSLFAEYGDTYRFNFGPYPIVWTRDVDLVKWIFTNDPEKFTKSKQSFLLKEVMDRSLAFTEGAEWYRKRSLMRNAFKKTALESFLPRFHQGAEELYQSWLTSSKKNKDVDPLEDFSRLTLDVIGRVGFGIDFEEQKNPGISQNSQDWKTLFETSMKVDGNAFYRYIGTENVKKFTSVGKSYVEARDRLYKTVRNVIENRRNQKITLENSPRDLLQYCIDSAGDEGGENKVNTAYTEDELVNEIFLFFLAGHDTTANLLTWALYYISKNPDIKEKCLNELKEANVPSDGSVPPWSVVNNLPYMTQVLKETLRLHPVAPAIGRQIINDEKFKDITIPANTVILSHSYAIHHDSRHYKVDKPEDIYKFNPENFSPENIKNRHPYAWIPFSVGPRNCIGMQFAMVEARVVLAYLLPRFEFKPTTTPKIYDRGLLTSENMKLNLQPILA